MTSVKGNNLKHVEKFLVKIAVLIIYKLSLIHNNYVVMDSRLQCNRVVLIWTEC